MNHIPEADGWPELQDFLKVINAAQCPIESVGCEIAYFPVKEAAANGIAVRLGSYIDVIFTESSLNDDMENALLLASNLVQAAKQCECWWSSLDIEIQRLRYLAGTVAPWGLMMRVIGHGRDEEEARKLWAETISRLAKAVAALPQDFRWHKPKGSEAVA